MAMDSCCILLNHKVSHGQWFIPGQSLPHAQPQPASMLTCQLAKDPQMLDGNDRQRIWTVQTSHSTLLLHALYSFKF